MGEDRSRDPKLDAETQPGKVLKQEEVAKTLKDAGASETDTTPVGATSENEAPSGEMTDGSSEEAGSDEPA